MPDLVFASFQALFLAHVALRRWEATVLSEMPGYTDAWLKHTQLPFDCLRTAGVGNQVMLYPISSCMDMKQDTLLDAI